MFWKNADDFAGAFIPQKFGFFYPKFSVEFNKFSFNPLVPGVH